MQAFSGCSEQGLLSSLGAQASRCGGFSYCGAWALGYAGLVVVVQGLVTVPNVDSSCTRDRTHGQLEE